MLAVGNKANGSLLFAGNGSGKEDGHWVNVWGIQHGELIGDMCREDALEEGLQAASEPSPSVKHLAADDAPGCWDCCAPAQALRRRHDHAVIRWGSLPPLGTYRHTGHMLDMDRSWNSTDFAVDVRGDNQVVVWNLIGAPPGTLMCEPSGPADLLIRPEQEHIRLELLHSSKVMDLCMAEDPDDAGGPVLIVGCADGSIKIWDLEGFDEGEICAEMRSLSAFEIFFPILLVLITFCQVVSFAFGPAVKWGDEIAAPANFTQKIAFGEFEFMVDFPKELLFWLEMKSVAAEMVLFMFLAAADVPEKLQTRQRLLQSGNWFKQEGQQSFVRPVHCLRSLLSVVQLLVDTYMSLCATVLVTPTFKSVARAYDCVRVPDHPAYLASAPTLRCYQGRVLYVVVLFTGLVPIYFWMLVPYAVIAGDCSYMSAKKMCMRQWWVLSAQRKATVLNLGFLHPCPDYIFQTLFVELLAKAALPVIVIETTSHPRLQMGLVTSVGAIMYLLALMYPAKANIKFNYAVLALKCFTLCAMICGCLTLVFEENSNIPTISLGVCAVLVPLVHFCVAIRVFVPRPDVQRVTTSSVPFAVGGSNSKAGELQVSGRQLLSAANSQSADRNGNIADDAKAQEFELVTLQT